MFLKISLFFFEWNFSTIILKLISNFARNLGKNVLSKSESVKFPLIESVICFFTDSSVNKYFSLLNQLIFTDSTVKKIFSLSNQSIFTEIMSEIWLIYSNLFLAIWMSQISLIISRFWLIQIYKVSLWEFFLVKILKLIIMIWNFSINYSQVLKIWNLVFSIFYKQKIKLLSLLLQFQ